MIKILQKQDQRKRQEGKDSVFVCHGQKIEEARLDTARLRYKRELSQQNAEPQVACT